MPENKLQIEPSETVGRHIEEIRTAPEGAEVFSALLSALVEFRNYDFIQSFPEFYSASQDLYAYRFHPDYVLTFTRRVKKSGGNPGTVILRLRTIQRA